MASSLESLSTPNKAFAVLLGNQFAQNCTIEGAEQVAAELVALEQTIAGDVDSVRTMIEYVTSAM